MGSTSPRTHSRSRRLHANGSEYLSITLAEFKNLKGLADRALAQVSEPDFFSQLDSESNSLAHIVKHLGGNLRSRWTDFLTTDGEKPDRNRDAEFEREKADTRNSAMRAWEEGWQRCFGTLGSLKPADMSATITIKGDALNAQVAIQRALAHTAQHVGQIVLLAKHFAGEDWKTLSVPRKRT